MKKEKTVIFRLETQLYNAISSFAKEKGYSNLSDLMREIVIFHFMGIMLGYFQGKDIDTMMDEFIVKYRNLIIEAEKEENEKNLNQQNKSCI